MVVIYMPANVGGIAVNEAIAGYFSNGSQVVLTYEMPVQQTGRVTETINLINDFGNICRREPLGLMAKGNVECSLFVEPDYAVETGSI